jgi:hypothetical protein
MGEKENRRKQKARGKKCRVHTICVRIHKLMPVVIERYQLYICIIIIIGMNVVDNLNSV